MSKFLYKAYGLILQTDFEISFLKKLDATSCQIDVYIKENGFNEEIIHQYQSNDVSIDLFLEEHETLVSYKKNLGIFHIRNGNIVNYKKNKNAHNDEFARVVLNTVMSYILYQRNFLVIHSSGVEGGEDISLFVGASGSGKSSLAYDIAKKGSYKIISEDFIPIKYVNNNLFLKSSYPVIKLDENIVDSNLNDKKIFKSLTDPFKRSVYLNDNFVESPSKKIKKIFFLEWGEQSFVEEISTNDAFKKLYSNTVRYLPPEKFLKNESNILKIKSKLFNQATCYSLSRRRESLKMQYKLLENFL